VLVCVKVCARSSAFVYMHVCVRMCLSLCVRACMCERVQKHAQLWLGCAYHPCTCSRVCIDVCACMRVAHASVHWWVVWSLSPWHGGPWPLLAAWTWKTTDCKTPLSEKLQTARHPRVKYFGLPWVKSYGLKDPLECNWPEGHSKPNFLQGQQHSRPLQSDTTRAKSLQTVAFNNSSPPHTRSLISGT